MIDPDRLAWIGRRIEEIDARVAAHRGEPSRANALVPTTESLPGVELALSRDGDPSEPDRNCDGLRETMNDLAGRQV